jgi:ATP-dependent Clp protease adaptor protein ClpS
MTPDILPEILEEEVAVADEKKGEISALLLYNDDVNTFEYVIECLVSICGHHPIQAEQCTYLIHYTGKSVVRNGSFSELKPLCEALLDKGLSAKIER